MFINNGGFDNSDNMILNKIIIIINSTWKEQNLQKNSERTKNMKNTQNYEFEKAWRNKCIFK